MASTSHARLTKVRRRAYDELFSDEPDVVFPARELVNGPDDTFLIDVFAYSFEMEGKDGLIYAAVTNGMSDHRMVEGDDPEQPRRRELIQYFREFTEGHAKRLRDMAWLPLFDGFLLDTHHTVPWGWPAVEGTPWKNALFLAPILHPHREFTFDVEGDEVSFLWHVPLSDAEHRYRMEHGVDGLLDRMRAIELPWIFDEGNRPSLVD